MVWLGLADGPYGRWRSPSGHPITVNLNEHTAVLTGIGTDGTLEVVNSLTGTRERWRARSPRRCGLALAAALSRPDLTRGGSRRGVWVRCRHRSLR